MLTRAAHDSFQRAETRQQQIKASRFALEYAGEWLPLPEPVLTDEWEVAQMTWAALSFPNCPITIERVRRTEARLGVRII